MPRRDAAPELKRFGENVRALREKKKLSQEKLAELADLDRTYIGGLERGERNATLATIIRVARALGTKVSTLCDGIER